MFAHYLPVSSGKETGASEPFWTEKWNAASLQVNLAHLARSTQWRVIRERLSPDMRILEAGCGLGQWVRLFDSAGYKATGLDYSETTIDRLIAAFPGHRWVVGDVLELPFPAGSFDAVASWGVIEHFEEGPLQVLSEFRRVLVPGGWLFVSVPFMNWRRLLQAQGRLNNRGQYSEEQAVAFHQYLLTRTELRTWLNEAGFSVDTIRVIGREAGAARLLGLRGKSACLTQRLAVRLLAILLPPKAIGQMVMASAMRPADMPVESASSREPV